MLHAVCLAEADLELQHAESLAEMTKQWLPAKERLLKDVMVNDDSLHFNFILLNLPHIISIHITATRAAYTCHQMS